MSIAPDGPRATMTRFGTVEPGVQLRSDASGRLEPSGQAVRKPAAEVLVTVTLATTAVGAPGPPMAGTPALPAICTARTAPCWSGLALRRVWRMRLGVTPTKYAPLVPVASVNQPEMSTMTST